MSTCMRSDNFRVQTCPPVPQQYGMGIRGAAWATTGSQILGTLALLYTLRTVSKVQRTFDLLQPAGCLGDRYMLTPIFTFTLTTTFTPRIHILVLPQVKPVLRVPSRRDLAVLASTLGPITLIYLCKNVTYIQLQLTATVLAPLTLAAHQLLYSLWSLTSFLTVQRPPVAGMCTLLIAWCPLGGDDELTCCVISLTGAAGTSGVDVLAGSPWCGYPSLPCWTAFQQRWEPIGCALPIAVGPQHLWHIQMVHAVQASMKPRKWRG